jgi:hypothetical protein
LEVGLMTVLNDVDKDREPATHRLRAEVLKLLGAPKEHDFPNARFPDPRGTPIASIIMQGRPGDEVKIAFHHDRKPGVWILVNNEEKVAPAIKYDSLSKWVATEPGDTRSAAEVVLEELRRVLPSDG